jgi:hypothetical protein
VEPALRFHVDTWDPAYGVAMRIPELEESTAKVRVDIEVSDDQWRPIDADGAIELPEAVLFVDGVRRIEARAWIERADGEAEPGICASYAAGVVRCDAAARIMHVDVHRGLFSSSPDAADVETRCGLYPVKKTAFSSPEELALALQGRMGQLEAEVARTAGSGKEGSLLILDGPRRHGQELAKAVGFIKTHDKSYLPPKQHPVVAELEAGQRTPVFLLGTKYSRHSWYLRLPGPTGAPWAGIVRCECSPDLLSDDVIELADVTARLLPRFASSEHKDPRAPQNLYPIGGLERELRRRLGDPYLLYRALRVAAYG